MSFRAARNRSPSLPTLDVLDVSWQEKAACAGTDVGLWFVSDRAESFPGERRARERRAKAFCGVCEVKEACLNWAYEVDDWHAILGGLTPDERRRMRRRELRRAAR